MKSPLTHLWIYPSLPLLATAPILCPLAASAQQGHILTDSEILVDRSSLWEAWDVAGGTVEITRDGAVRPRFIRKNINAALDAPGFSSEDGRGGTIAGSNARDARLVIDGDMTTAWEPDANDPLGNW